MFEELSKAELKQYYMDRVDNIIDGPTSSKQFNFPKVQKQLLFVISVVSSLIFLKMTFSKKKGLKTQKARISGFFIAKKQNYDKIGKVLRVHLFPKSKV